MGRMARALLILFILWPGSLVAQGCAKEEDALKQCKNKESYEKEFKKVHDEYAKRIGKLAAERVRKIQELKKKYGVKD